MSFRYAVLGAGRQGIAAAYDLALQGDAEAVIMADRDLATAQASASRANHLSGTSLIEPAQLDASDPNALMRLLEDIDSVLSAVPSPLNLGITEAAIDSRAHMCDLGGNTALVNRQLAFDEQARSRGVSVIPDCGQVPGMGTSLMACAIEMLEVPEGVKLWDGGIPQDPVEPWNYLLTFNIGGLTNEYFGTTVFLRDGQPIEVSCFDPDGYELLDFPEPFGTLEAFVTAGGTSTAPSTYAGKLQYLENRTLRYPGHAAQWKAFSDAGLLETAPIVVGDAEVVPREVLHTLLGPKLEASADARDVILVRVVATGRDQGRAALAQIDLIDRFDPETGFTAMQRCTGWDGAIVTAMMARGETPAGAIPREISVDRQHYVDELRQRGFELEIEKRYTD